MQNIENKNSLLQYIQFPWQVKQKLDSSHGSSVVDGLINGLFVHLTLIGWQSCRENFEFSNLLYLFPLLPGLGLIS